MDNVTFIVSMFVIVCVLLCASHTARKDKHTFYSRMLFGVAFFVAIAMVIGELIIK